MKKTYAIYQYRKPYAGNKEYVTEFNSLKEAENAVERAKRTNLSKYYEFVIIVQESDWDENVESKS